MMTCLDPKGRHAADLEQCAAHRRDVSRPDRSVVHLLSCLLGACLALGATIGFAAPTPSRVLRVCADPNNLPFSNRAGEGFENALATLVAHELAQQLSYTWHAQRRGFIRETLIAGVCDVVMGVPSELELALTTRPYYRSTYVFVSQRARALHVRSFDDSRLPQLRIGVHVIGDDYASVPPAQALAARGMVQNVRGYSIYGDYSKPNPPAALIHAVSAGDIDLAVAWGPLAGFFAGKSTKLLDVTPVDATTADLRAPLAYDISMGVRRNETALKKTLDDLIARRCLEIRAILERYHVPVVG
jgi:mxaJ protein